MQRKASARWQGTHPGRQRHALGAERHAAGHALLVQGALRRRQGNESRGARRRRARRLLHDGAVVHAQQRGLHRRRRSTPRRGSRWTRSTASRRSPRSISSTRAQVPGHRRRASSPRSRPAPRSNCVVSRALSPSITVTLDAALARLTATGIDGRPRPRRPRAAARPSIRPTASAAKQREAVDDGWERRAPSARRGRRRRRRRRPSCAIQPARTIIARNESPDIPFTQSINPYQGCEHGCIYCYARPTHAYLDLSPGLDFETKLFAKPNAAELLRAELAKPGYRLRPDRARHQHRSRTSRSSASGRSRARVIEVLAECDHPLTITTKGALIERDLDLLAPMAAKGLVRVFVSIAMLDRELARKLDPRAAAPQRRLADRQGAERRRRAGRRQRRAGHSAAHRPASSRRSSRPRRRPARGTPAGRCCGCRARSRRSSATGSTRTIRCAPRT